MSTLPLRSSENGPDGASSIRSSISDIPVADSAESSPRQLDGSTPRKSNSLDSPRDSLEDDLELEDPLSRVYIREEFERFSGTEIAFITASCTGVLTVPLLYLLVSQLNVGV